MVLYHFLGKAKQRQSNLEILRFVYVRRHALHIQFISYNCTNNRNTLVLLWNAFLIFSYYYQYIFTAHDVQKNTQIQFYLYLFILRFGYWISCCPHADHSLLKFLSPYIRSSGSGLQGVPLSLYCAHFRGSPFFLHSDRWHLPLCNAQPYSLCWPRKNSQTFVRSIFLSLYD
jgi:hypothetical protein